MYMMPSWKHTV